MEDHHFSIKIGIVRMLVRSRRRCGVGPRWMAYLAQIVLLQDVRKVASRITSVAEVEGERFELG